MRTLAGAAAATRAGKIASSTTMAAQKNLCVPAVREPRLHSIAPMRIDTLLARAEVVCQEVGDQRPIAPRHVVAHVIAAFEHDHLLRARGLGEDAPRLLEGNKVLGP